MSVIAIRNIINSQIDSQLVNAKKKLREEGKKQLYKLKDKLPTIDELKKQFISNACSLNAQNKVQKNFDKYKKLLEQIISKIEAGYNKLDKVKKKLEGILTEIIPKIQNIIDILQPILKILSVLIITLPIALNAIPTSAPGVTAGVILKIQKIIDKAKEKIGQYLALISAVSIMIGIYLDKISKLITPLEKILAIFKEFIERVKKILATLEFLFLQYLKKCNIADQTPTNNNGDINTSTLDENIPFIDENESLIGITDRITDLYNDLLGELEIKGKKLLIERISNIQFGFRTSYKVKTVPLS